jgi:hypothetical protein
MQWKILIDSSHIVLSIEGVQLLEERLNDQEDVSIESITRIYVIEYLRFQINKHL